MYHSTLGIITDLCLESRKQGGGSSRNMIHNTIDYNLSYEKIRIKRNFQRLPNAHIYLVTIKNLSVPTFLIRFKNKGVILLILVLFLG